MAIMMNILGGGIIIVPFIHCSYRQVTISESVGQRVAAVQICVVAESTLRQCRKEGAWLCSNKVLFIKTDGGPSLALKL